MNQMYGYQILPEDNPSINYEFEGTQLISPDRGLKSISPQLRVFAHPHSNIRSYYSHEYGEYVYVWGMPAHPYLTSNDIPERCAKIVANKSYDFFKELAGTFVVIADEPEQHRMTFVTDILGVRPMFLGTRSGRLVFGSQVWPILKAGLSNGAINYDAVSAWIAYLYNCTGGSLFSDLQRLPPGTAVVFQGNQYYEVTYAEFKADSRIGRTQNVAEEAHDIVHSTVKTLLREHDHVSLSLSGGFDSRYLLALINSIGKISIDCATVGYPAEESRVAVKVAETLGVPIEMYPVDSSIWDVFDEVYHFTPDGFPISKNLNYLISEHYPETPMINGYMGDSLMRGSKDTFQGKYEDEWYEDLADVLQRKHLSSDFHFIKKDIARRILMRSLSPMEEAVQKARPMGRVFAWSDYYYRQRFYISNNFIQHLNICEALLPFYSWELLSYKISCDSRLFSSGIYKNIFQTYFRELSDIPHASELRGTPGQSRRISKCAQRWAGEILALTYDKKWDPLLQKREVILRSIAGMLGMRQGENLILGVKRLCMLQERIQDAGLDFDWDCI